MGHPRRRWNRATTTSHVAVAVEHVQHGYLLSINGFAAVVTFEGVVRSREKAQTTPAALVGEGQDAREWCLRDDREVELLRHVLGGAVELIEERSARGARLLHQR
jgi:hypothetical protein